MTGAGPPRGTAPAGGTTTCTTTVRYESKEARDAALQTGMATGVEESYEVLDGVLTEMKKAGAAR